MDLPDIDLKGSKRLQPVMSGDRLVFLGLVLAGIGVLLLLYFLFLAPVAFLSDTVKAVIILVSIVALLLVSGKFSTVFFDWRWKKLYLLLYKECDPFAFCSRLERYIQAMASDYYVKGFVFDLIRGLYYCGKSAEAMEKLGSTSLFSSGINGMHERLAWHQLKFTLLLNMDHLAQAGMALSEMQQYMDSLNDETDTGLQGFLAVCKEFVFTGHILIAMENGSTEGAEEVFRHGFETSKVVLHRVFNQYNLGMVCMMEKRFYEAKAAFEYVIANGNRLFLVDKAKEHLLEIAGSRNTPADAGILPELS